MSVPVWDPTKGEPGPVVPGGPPTAARYPSASPGGLGGAEAQAQKQSDLERAVGQRVSQREDVRARAEEVLRNAGVNVDHPKVQAILQASPEEILSPQGQGLVAVFAALYPSEAVTAYSTALSEAGFLEGFPEPPLTAAQTQLLRHKPGLTPAALGERGDYAIQPDTGWVMYRSGVLYDPESRQVIFEPNSMAPGSPLYLKKVTERWSEDKVAEWRSRLGDMGYLTTEQSKASGVDQVFLEALRAFHVARYQSFGKALPLDLSTTAAGGELELTAREFQAQIRNAVREQYQRVFGQDPTDAEVEDWSGFVTNTSLRIQRRLVRQRGLTSDQALGVATTEAEERLIERLEGSPQAEILADVADNTRLRDGLAQAARVSAAFG